VSAVRDGKVVVGIAKAPESISGISYSRNGKYVKKQGGVGNE
jgi:hypothetical protein